MVMNTSNPFSQICYTLMQPVAPTLSKTDTPKNSSRTESIRVILRQAGRPMSAAEILFDAGDQLPYSANTSLVSMLLKWDIKQGRVTFEDGRYNWNSETAAAEAQAVREALKLLRRHGYKCSLIEP
jgi:hypothetical protein